MNNKAWEIPLRRKRNQNMFEIEVERAATPDDASGLARKASKLL